MDRHEISSARLTDTALPLLYDLPTGRLLPTVKFLTRPETMNRNGNLTNEGRINRQDMAKTHSVRLCHL